MSALNLLFFDEHLIYNQEEPQANLDVEDSREALVLSRPLFHTGWG